MAALYECYNNRDNSFIHNIAVVVSFKSLFIVFHLFYVFAVKLEIRGATRPKKKKLLFRVIYMS